LFSFGFCSLGFSSADLAADFVASATLAIHAVVFRHPLVQAREDVADQRITMTRPAIMHPFPIAVRFHQAGALEESEVPGHFRLDHAKRVRQFANARLTAREQIEQTQPRWISQRLKKERRLAISVWVHSSHIRKNIYVSIAVTEILCHRQINFWSYLAGSFNSASSLVFHNAAMV
jgi:hypothetical protein